MIDHLVINTSAELHDATVAFYVTTLEPLGYQKMVDMFDGGLVGLGTTRPDFWIASLALPGSPAEPSRTHFAFHADGRHTLFPVVLTLLRAQTIATCARCPSYL